MTRIRNSVGTDIKLRISSFGRRLFQVDTLDPNLVERSVLFVRLDVLNGRAYIHPFDNSTKNCNVKKDHNPANKR